MLLRRAISLATKYHTINHKQFRTMTAIIAASNKRILSIGTNRYDRLSFPYKRYNGFGPMQGLHAEMDALLRLKHGPKGLTMIVFGTTRSGTILQTTKPCRQCMVSIRIVGITTIIFLENGVWKKVNIRSL